MRKLRPDKLTEVLQVVSDSLALATELHCRELLSISPELTEFCFCVLKLPPPPHTERLCGISVP